ncbi:unnamed protein product [Caenorhabditis angaria]|uniref:Uncharacterized protein n=1 Tax=Caenorhabditis angaria TaxID=860376 RepID=A0A9P1IXE5_9PELO|nr:unnamed protein product [Caenorhabditis angaria]
MSFCLTNIFVPLTAFISLVILFDSAYWVANRSIESNSIIDELPEREMILTSIAILSLIGIVSCRKPLLAFTFSLMIYSSCVTLFHCFHVFHILIKNGIDVCQINEFKQFSCSVNNSIIAGITALSYIFTTIAAMSCYDRLTTVTLSLSERRALATQRAQPLLISAHPIISPPQHFNATTHNHERDSFV